MARSRNKARTPSPQPIPSSARKQAVCACSRIHRDRQSSPARLKMQCTAPGQSNRNENLILLVFIDLQKTDPLNPLTTWYVGDRKVGSSAFRRQHLAAMTVTHSAFSASPLAISCVTNRVVSMVYPTRTRLALFLENSGIRPYSRPARKAEKFAGSARHTVRLLRCSCGRTVQSMNGG
jgi:hypothetical protein